MSRHYGTEEALNLILDDGEADSDDDFAEPMCPGSDEEFEFNTDDQDFSVDNRYIMDQYNKKYAHKTNKSLLYIRLATVCFRHEDFGTPNEDEVGTDSSPPPGANANLVYTINLFICIYV